MAKETRRVSNLSLPISQSELGPSYAFSGRNLNYTGSRPNNVYAASVQGTYSRYGTKQQDGRSQRVSTNSVSGSDTSRYIPRRQRSYSHGSNFPSSPLRSPPVPTSTNQPQSFVWHSTEPQTSTGGSRRGSFQSPTTDLEQSWNSISMVPPIQTLKQYSERLQDRERGVPMQERLVNNKLERVFTGADAVEWFMANMDGVTSVAKAQLTGQQLLNCGLITKVKSNEDQKFTCTPNSFYTFPLLSKPNPVSDSPQSTVEIAGMPGHLSKKLQKDGVYFYKNTLSI